jgi:prepilin-type N-terminal cleavage/methylation domain-containing protein
MRKLSHHSRRGGFTLIELTIAVTLGLSVATLLMSLVNQQFAFMRIYGAQAFLNREAPLVSVHVSRLVAKADRFRLHASIDDALAGRSPRLEASPVLALVYEQPDGSSTLSLLAFERAPGGGGALNYYLPTMGPLEPPEWSVTRKANDVAFSIEEGVLRMTLTGPAGEVITYSGTMQR